MSVRQPYAEVILRGLKTAANFVSFLAHDTGGFHTLPAMKSHLDRIREELKAEGKAPIYLNRTKTEEIFDRKTAMG